MTAAHHARRVTSWDIIRLVLTRSQFRPTPRKADPAEGGALNGTAAKWR